jgi:hypothetical protein
MPRRRDDYEGGPDDQAQNGNSKMLVAALVIGGLCLLGVAVLAAALTLASGARPRGSGAPAEAGAAQAGAAREFAFGEQVRAGDLLVSVEEAYSSSNFAGQRYGRFTLIQMMLVRLRVENTGRGKIIDWPGWQGKAVVEDEHGNRFKPLALEGWSALPHNDIIGGGWSGDTGARVHPGTTYVNALYYEYAPPTSRHIIVTAPLAGRQVRFRGPHRDKWSIDRTAALKAVEGKVLSVGDLFRDLSAKKPNIEMTYPIGCTMRAGGVIASKWDQRKSDAARTDNPFAIHITYQPWKPLKDAASVVCYTNDAELYQRLKVDGSVTLQGVLRFVVEPRAGSPNQAHLYDCREVPHEPPGAP